ncbi:MAG: hypothetical protein MJ236_05840, partial [Clostridia bacterium]|nr:hypothetical protein [Clostridia bacterium]
MILNIKGDINEYYVQTLCLLFFPVSKFSHDQDESNVNERADVTVVDNGTQITATVELKRKRKIETSTHTESKENSGI